jgi:site-specific recombinase XerC
MAMDPEELVTLTDHGTMRLHSAVVRAMILSAKERKRATILREGRPAILHFKQIRDLGAKWDERRESSARGNRFQERQRQQRRIRSRGNGRKNRSIAR